MENDNFHPSISILGYPAPKIPVERYPHRRILLFLFFSQKKISARTFVFAFAAIWTDEDISLMLYN